MNVKEYPVIENIKYCLINTIECYPQLLFWCLLAILINVALPVLSSFLPKVVIEKITSSNGIRNLIFVTLIFMFTIALLSGFKRFVEKYASFLKYRMNTYYTRKVAKKGMTTDYSNQEKDEFRKLQSESFRACNGHYSPLTQVYDVLIALLSTAFGFIIYFGILTRLNIFVIVFLIATTLASYFLNKKIIRWTADHIKEKIGYQQKTNYINSVSGDVRSAKDIRLYGLSVWFDKLYRFNMEGLAGWYKRYAKIVFGVSVCDSGLSLLREGIAYAYLIYLALNLHISVAEFVLYFSVITGFSLWLSGILGQVNLLKRINLTVNYMRGYLEFPEKYIKEGGIEPAISFPKTIELFNVSYRYEGAKEDTLKNISLKIEPGEHLAVVGLNGAGKTTLVKLICGLVDPTEGSVLYDGIDVREYNRISYYKLFSAMFQQYSIMPVTLEEIVAETVPENIDGSKVELSLRQAGLWEKVSKLPKGVKHEFGKTIYDDGVELSGGEIQKLLLARALYRFAPVMILDEPTAALDPISESKIYKSYNKIMMNRSTIFISHRLASTRFCDRVLLIENGSIIEEGTHESLLSKKGRYHDLFETQAKYYCDHPVTREVNYG
ncbi:MAG TPA: ABC transporter ATP-binding protein [Clostridiales bacterium]|nr:ABC transporter ATP-binding protein [Clostridiales bacterium]